MNKEWSNLNKKFQDNLTKSRFSLGISSLLELRSILYESIINETKGLCAKDYYAQPYINASGFESKTIAYSIYHIYRIEDIVLNILILKKDKDIFMNNNYQEKMNSKIITTGNELKKEEIAVFSSDLKIEELFSYINEVYNASNKYIESLKYEDLKIKFNDNDMKRVIDAGVVNKQEAWLIEYWCSKDIKGLLKMPFSRHHIMHVEALMRIKSKLK